MEFQELPETHLPETNLPELDLSKLAAKLFTGSDVNEEAEPVHAMLEDLTPELLERVAATKVEGRAEEIRKAIKVLLRQQSDRRKEKSLRTSQIQGSHIKRAQALLARKKSESRAARAARVLQLPKIKAARRVARKGMPRTVVAAA